MKTQKFFICQKCKNLVAFISGPEHPMSCCATTMTELIPNTTEAATEKHLPEVTVSGNEVSVVVGSTLHPMEEAHHIAFIYVETEHGGMLKSLKAGEEPKATFAIASDKPVAVYEYCNLHGLWKIEIK
ncbi:MAG: desulfoferrodoxin [Turicibacter sp.]|nr:desulfoferrodoxin [Turicibacter sp.]